MYRALGYTERTFVSWLDQDLLRSPHHDGLSEVTFETPAIALYSFHVPIHGSVVGNGLETDFPEDLALRKARVDPAADAEALFWEITVADAASNNQYPYTMYTHYYGSKSLPIAA